MKRIKYITFTLIIAFLLSINVYAASGNMTVSTTKANIGDTFTITVNINGASSWNIHVNASGPVSDGCLIEQVENNPANLDSEDINKTFSTTCKVTGEGTININLNGDVKSSKEENSVSLSDTKTITVRSLSSNTSLSSLTIDGREVVNGERLNTDAASVTIGAKASDANAKVSGDIGFKQLEYNDNTFNITVTAENGAQKTYTIYVFRNDSRDSNAYLSSITVSKGSIKFNRASYNYNVNVASDVESITIEAHAESAKATVEGAGTKKLKLGRNTFNITVQAENGTTKTYVVKVTRKDDRSDNNKLKSLKISKGELKFNSNKTEYELAVDYDVTKISFEAQAEDKKSTITGLEERNLEIGPNVINIDVKAENGDVRTYKITVIRNKEVTETNENKAKNIAIKGHTLNFEPNTTEYTLETRLSFLEIDVELNTPTSTFNITGNENLHDGSIIQITITDKDANNNIYTIKISNPNEGENSDKKSDSVLLNLPKFVYYIVLWVSVVIVLILTVLVCKEKSNLRDMFRQHKRHAEEPPSNYLADNSGLTGEPTYETLEMAKINLEDYLDDEKRAKHKNKTKSSDEAEKEISDNNFETIADITEEDPYTVSEEAIDSTLPSNDEINETDETIQDESIQGETIQDEMLTDDKESADILSIINDSLNDTEETENILDPEEQLQAEKPKTTRAIKNADKTTDLTNVVEEISKMDLHGDIDDLINASSVNEEIEEKSTTSDDKTSKKSSSTSSKKDKTNAKKEPTKKKTKSPNKQSAEKESTSKTSKTTTKSTKTSTNASQSTSSKKKKTKTKKKK